MMSSLKIQKITLANSKLFIDPRVSNLTEVKVSCFAKNNPELKAQRTFTVVKEKRKDSLVHLLRFYSITKI